MLYMVGWHGIGSSPFQQKKMLNVLINFVCLVIKSKETRKY